jgi:octaprenyl-diphosphate synthase
MESYKQEALGILKSFPESEIRAGFVDLVNFVTDRKY